MEVSVALHNQVSALLAAPQMVGLKDQVMIYMKSFANVDNIKNMNEILKKVDPEARFDALYHIMLSVVPKGFDTKNEMLWHGLTNVILNTLAMSHPHPIQDEKIKEIRELYSNGNKPYQVDIN